MRFREFMETFNLGNQALRKHIVGREVGLDTRAEYFLAWPGSQQILSRLKISPEQFRQNPKSVEQAMSREERTYFGDWMWNYSNELAANAPTWTHAAQYNKETGVPGSERDYDAGVKQEVLPRNTWLVHFGQDPIGIQKSGFKGLHDMTRMGITVSRGMTGNSEIEGPNSQRGVKEGGYGFAYIANSRAAMMRAGGSGEMSFGVNDAGGAVLFQSSGILIHHESDSEEQVMFYTPGVDKNRLIHLEFQRDDHDFKNNPWAKGRGVKGTRPWSVMTRDGRSIYTGSYVKCVEWVVANERQYASLLYGA